MDPETLKKDVLSLDKTSYDVVICGTGLPQSLLVLALSRSGKKILHIDKNSYYGGSGPSFNLNDARDWAQRLNKAPESPLNAPYANASLHKATEDETQTTKLFPPQRYSLSIAPQLIHNRSEIRHALHTSKIDNKLGFLAVGNWWVYVKEKGHVSPGTLVKVPTTAGEILKDEGGFFKRSWFMSKIGKGRDLLALVRLTTKDLDHETQKRVWEPYQDLPFSTFLAKQFNLNQPKLQDALHALTLTPNPPDRTTTAYALPRLARYITSMGILDPSTITAHIPDFGITSIVDMACQDGAVGGAVYATGQGLEAYPAQREPDASMEDSSKAQLAAKLQCGVTVFTEWLVGGIGDVPHSRSSITEPTQDPSSSHLFRSISIVSEHLQSLLPPFEEEAPGTETASDFMLEVEAQTKKILAKERPEVPSAAVVVFPSGSLDVEGISTPTKIPPVNVLVHSSHTGQCPRGQSILYASVAMGGDQAPKVLEKAVKTLLKSIKVRPSPQVLWSLSYEAKSSPAPASIPDTGKAPLDNVLIFPDMPSDLVLDDSVLSWVRDVWHKIVGGDVNNFMVLEDWQDIMKRRMEARKEKKPKDDAPDDSPKDDAPKDDATKNDASKDTATKDDASKDTAPKVESPSV